MSSPAGDVEVKILKFRERSLFAELLEARRRSDRALGRIVTAYMTGTSTRKIEDLVKALGCKSGVSKATGSWIRGELDREVVPVR